VWRTAAGKFRFPDILRVAPYPLRPEQKVADICQNRLTSFSLTSLSLTSLSTVATNFNRTINLYGCQSALVSIGNPLLSRRRHHHEFLCCFLRRDAVLKFPVATTANTAVCTTTILDDIKRWRERPLEYMTRHNGGHDDSKHNSGQHDGGNGYHRAYLARAWQARQRDTKGWPLFLFCLSIQPLLLLCHKGYCTTTGREASASLPQTDPS
jgi:hypothetical protein